MHLTEVREHGHLKKFACIFAHHQITKFIRHYKIPYSLIRSFEKRNSYLQSRTAMRERAAVSL
jgi:hypothetical protein